MKWTLRLNDNIMNTHYHFSALVVVNEAYGNYTPAIKV